MANKVQHGSSLTNSGTNGSGVTYSSFTYDSNGNTTHDGRTGQDLTWNMLNLISGVSKTESGTTTQLASYSWYADGTKYSAERPDGTGYVYKGNVIYEKAANGTLTLDCVLTTGGRIVANKNSSGTITGYTVYHHITDHLGSVRAITNASTGNVVETSDFLPFGTRWSQTSGSSSATITDATNRWRYSGKEEQKAINSTLPLIDYGARMYDPTIARWMSMDPMAEKYYPMSPYEYCANNPIYFVDYHGDSLWVKNHGNEYQFNNGSFYLNGQKVKAKGFLKSVGRALENIMNTEVGATMIQELTASTNSFTIVRGDDDQFKASDIIKAYGIERIVRFDPYVESRGIESVLGGSGGVIVWNPNYVQLPRTQGLTETPFADLAHEMFHALDANRGLLTDEKTFGIKNNEWQAVYRENTLRSQAGLPLRTHYQVAINAHGVRIGGAGPRMLTLDNQIIRPSWY